MEIAQALYDAPDQGLRDFGFTDDDLALDDTEVWPCNWKTVQLFIALGTQWRSGMGGPTGLDYAAIPPTAKMTGIKLTPERFDGIRVMEGEALRVMGERSKKK